MTGATRDKDAISTATAATFERDVLQEKEPVVVEFMSYGCAHCRTLEPVLQRVAEMPEFEKKIFRVNVAVDEGLAKDFEVQGTPTLIMFLNGREVSRAEGPPPTVSGVLSALNQPVSAG
jgi:thioredoxin 1